MRAILFDFGQTLADSADGFRLAEKSAQRCIYQALGLRDWGDFVDQYRRIRAAHHKRSSLSRVAIWSEVFQHFRQPAPSASLTAWETEYWQTVKRLTRMFAETRPVLEKLSASHRLGVVSNTQGQVGAEEGHRLAEMPELEALFDAVVIAGEGGTPPKPDPEPFLVCLETMNVDPAQALYVGDDYEKDVLGAMGAGLRPVWLKHRDVRRTWPDVKRPAAPVIETLEALLDLESLLRYSSDPPTT